jgi:hypothetical protein
VRPVEALAGPDHLRSCDPTFAEAPNSRELPTLALAATPTLLLPLLERGGLTDAASAALPGCAALIPAASDCPRAAVWGGETEVSQPREKVKDEESHSCVCASSVRSGNAGVRMRPAVCGTGSDGPWATDPPIIEWRTTI